MNPPNRIPTQRQYEVLRFIADSVESNGYPPSLREIARHLNVASTQGPACHVEALERKGMLTTPAKQVARALRITPEGHAFLKRMAEE